METSRARLHDRHDDMEIVEQDSLYNIYLAAKAYRAGAANCYCDDCECAPCCLLGKQLDDLIEEQANR